MRNKVGMILFHNKDIKITVSRNSWSLWLMDLTCLDVNTRIYKNSEINPGELKC